MCSKVGNWGLDLTVRPGGKVEPATVETELPKLIDIAAKYNLATDMIVTGIVYAADPYTEKVLKTASSNAIKFYRLGWFEYDNKSGIWETLQKFRSGLIDIVELTGNIKFMGLPEPCRSKGRWTCLEFA
jgi:L-ribulose-5-phosphate 3-epimerase